MEASEFEYAPSKSYDFMDDAVEAEEYDEYDVELVLLMLLL